MAQTDLDKQLEGYFRHLEAERSLSAYTVRNYRNDLAHLAAFLRAQDVASLAAVDRNVLRRYLAALVEQGFVRPSIARKLSAIRSLFRYLLREGVMAADPTANLSTPKLERRLPEFLSQAETTALIKAVPDPAAQERKDAEVKQALAQRDRALLELLYAAGLRVSEVAGLDLKAVDVGRRELRVWGKGGKERMTLMGKPAAAALKRYLHKGRKVLAGDKKQNAVFLNRFGGRLTPRSVQALLRKYALLAGVEKHVHPHLLRHTFATHMLDGGADLRVVQELLGHSKLATTQIYTHVSQKQLRKVYDSAFFNQMRDRKEGEDADPTH